MICIDQMILLSFWIVKDSNFVVKRPLKKHLYIWYSVLHLNVFRDREEGRQAEAERRR